jgi:hypothetical protein
MVTARDKGSLAQFLGWFSIGLGAAARGGRATWATCWVVGRDTVQVEEVPDPQIVNDRDAIARVTSIAICGSDLHRVWLASLAARCSPAGRCRPESSWRRGSVITSTATSSCCAGSSPPPSEPRGWDALGRGGRAAGAASRGAAPTGSLANGLGAVVTHAAASGLQVAGGGTGIVPPVAHEHLEAVAAHARLDAHAAAAGRAGDLRHPASV